MDEDEATLEELQAAMLAGIPTTIEPGPMPVAVDWPGMAAVWGDDTRKWAEEITYDEDPDRDT